MTIIEVLDMLNDTVCVDNPLKATFIVYIPFIVLPFHISNITAILVHHKFHQNVYFLLLNLSVSDAISPVNYVPPTMDRGPFLDYLCKLCFSDRNFAVDSEKIRPQG